MSLPVSRELIVTDDGGHFIVAGNPTEGYVAVRVTKVADIGHFRRKWEAVEAVRNSAATVDVA